MKKCVLNPETGLSEMVDLTDAEVAVAHETAERYLLKRADYRKLRQQEYPPIGDQLDAIMKWLATETELTVPAELKSVAMKCMSVKAKYPKPKGD